MFRSRASTDALQANSHPDKLTLAVNQTKEEADNIFVELTKAYKACVPFLTGTPTRELTIVFQKTHG